MLSVWITAARPKTLGGALSPVVVALATAVCHTGGVLRPLPAVLCAAFAILMQIDANLINDYYDCLKGRDDDNRLGPPRVCAQGLVTLPAMRRAIVLVSVLCLLCGLPLIYWGGWWMLAVAALCLLGAFAYTTHLAQWALGDAMVVVFFGLVPVVFTYFLQTGELVGEACTDVWLLALAMGLVTDCLLIVNNFRDYDADRSHGKLTLIVLLGRRSGIVLYLLLGLVAVALVVPLTPSWHLLAPFVASHLFAWLRMVRIGRGRALNAVLGITGLNICLFALLTTLSFTI